MTSGAADEPARAPSATLSWPCEGVALVLLDNPPMNFGSYALLEQLLARLEEAAQARAKTLVLASDVPGYLMAHAWLPDVLDAYDRPEVVQHDPRLWRQVTELLERGPFVSISCNQGQAWGGGAEISWACNLRTAAESATYAQIECILGVIPGGGGTARLARLAGQSLALDMLLTGEPKTAGELAALGVVHRVYPDPDARAATLEWAATIATRPARALAACKRGVLQTWDLGIADALRLEGYIFNSTMTPVTRQTMRDIQDRYDHGADSYEAYGLPPRFSRSERQ